MFGWLRKQRYPSPDPPPEQNLPISPESISLDEIQKMLLSSGLFREIDTQRTFEVKAPGCFPSEIKQKIFGEPNSITIHVDIGDLPGRAQVGLISFLETLKAQIPVEIIDIDSLGGHDHNQRERINLPIRSLSELQSRGATHIGLFTKKGQLLPYDLTAFPEGQIYENNYVNGHCFKDGESLDTGQAVPYADKDIPAVIFFRKSQTEDDRPLSTLPAGRAKFEVVSDTRDGAENAINPDT